MYNFNHSNVQTKHNLWLFVSDKIRKYECPTCHSLFSLKKDLDRHVAGVHEGLKPFQCRLCDKSFGRKDSLKRHVRCCHKKGSEE